MIVNYQPIVDLRSRAVVKIEALSRRPALPAELNAPAAFIPYAERNGLIRELTDWIVRRALEDRAAWPALRALDLSVNLSIANLDEPDIADRVREALAAASAPAASFWFEIGAEALTLERGRKREAIERLRDAGVRFSLDGFGPDFSETSHLELARLPVSELKIDAAFVAAMERDAAHRAVVRGIVDLGESLGLAVVAKGVESEEAAERLARMRCPFAQGFHFGRPLEAAALAAEVGRAANGA